MSSSSSSNEVGLSEATGRLYKWLVANKLRFKDKKEANEVVYDAQGNKMPEYLSFSLLNGGVVKIPAILMSEFYQLYLIDFTNKVDLFYSELHLPNRRLAFDMDFKHVVEQKQLIEYIQILQAVVSKLFSSTKEAPQCIICISTKTKSSGVHVYFFNVILTYDTGMRVYAACVKALMDKFQDQNWSKILDSQIYKSGLRLIGSKKISNCPHLSGGDCENCQHGKIVQPFIYWPSILLNEKFEIDKRHLKRLLTIPIQCIIACSLYIEQTRDLTPTTIPDDSPYYSIVSKRKKQDIQADSKVTKELKKESHCNTKLKDSQDPIFIAIQKCIQNNFDGHYSAIEVDYILTNAALSNRSSYLATIKKGSVNGQFCQNVNRQHKGAQIYFIIKKQNGGTIQQRCYSTKNELEGRVYGLCSQFCSSPEKVATEYYKDIFPFQFSKKKLASIIQHPNIEIPSILQLLCPELAVLSANKKKLIQPNLTSKGMK